jgi:hypothetical protein
MNYKINKQEVNYQTEGKKTSGDDIVLLHQAIDLTFGKVWADKGFIVERLFEENVDQELKTKTSALLISLWRNAGLDISNNFELTQYHLKADNKELHLAAVNETKLLSINEFPVPIQLIEKRISEICQIPLVALNPFDGQSVFHFRVVRPNSNDNNPLHRDVWLEDYANCINLYIPIAGSNSNSSLSIIPGSHHWPESKTERTEQGAIIENVKFNVPAVTSIKGDYEVVRPDPKENEVLVFSPYLIHGGAVNLNTDQTRISIELRLWKKN